jgi:hypothetical protein
MDKTPMHTPLKMKVLPTAADRQWRIESDYLASNLIDKSWKDIYVSFSGYFGNINPNTFAAAPELLEALRNLTHPMASDEDLSHALAVIAKAEGREA